MVEMLPKPRGRPKQLLRCSLAKDRKETNNRRAVRSISVTDASCESVILSFLLPQPRALASQDNNLSLMPPSQQMHEEVNPCRD